jgi:hypothetical protein
MARPWIEGGDLAFEAAIVTYLVGETMIARQIAPFCKAHDVWPAFFNWALFNPSVSIWSEPADDPVIGIRSRLFAALGILQRSSPESDVFSAVLQLLESSLAYPPLFTEILMYMTVSLVDRVDVDADINTFVDLITNGILEQQARHIGGDKFAARYRPIFFELLQRLSEVPRIRSVLFASTPFCAALMWIVLEADLFNPWFALIQRAGLYHFNTISQEAWAQFERVLEGLLELLLEFQNISILVNLFLALELFVSIPDSEFPNLFCLSHSLDVFMRLLTSISRCDKGSQALIHGLNVLRWACCRRVLLPANVPWNSYIPVVSGVGLNTDLLNCLKMLTAIPGSSFTSIENALALPLLVFSSIGTEHFGSLVTQLTEMCQDSPWNCFAVVESNILAKLFELVCTDGPADAFGLVLRLFTSVNIWASSRTLLYMYGRLFHPADGFLHPRISELVRGLADMFVKRERSPQSFIHFQSPSEYISMKSLTPRQITSSFTVAFWLLLDGFPTEVHAFSLITLEGTSRILHFFLASGSFWVTFLETGGAAVVHSCPLEFPILVWFHLLIHVSVSTGISVFVNGTCAGDIPGNYTMIAGDYEQILIQSPPGKAVGRWQWSKHGQLSSIAVFSGPMGPELPGQLVDSGADGFYTVLALPNLVSFYSAQRAKDSCLLNSVANSSMGHAKYGGTVCHFIASFLQVFESSNGVAFLTTLWSLVVRTYLDGAIEPNLILSLSSVVLLLLKASRIAPGQLLQSESYPLIAYFLCSCSADLLTALVWTGFYDHFREVTNLELKRQIGKVILFNPMIWSRLTFENAMMVFDCWDCFFQEHSLEYSDLCTVAFMLDLLDNFTRDESSDSTQVRLSTVSNSIGSVIFAICRQSFTVTDAGAILDFCVKKRSSPIIVSLLIWLEKLFRTPDINPMDFHDSLRVFAPLLFIFGDTAVRCELAHIFDRLRELETENPLSVFVDFVRLIQTEARRQRRISDSRSSDDMCSANLEDALDFLLLLFCCRAVDVEQYSWASLANAKELSICSVSDLFLAFLAGFEVTIRSRASFRLFLQSVLSVPANQTAIRDGCTEFTTFLLTYYSVLIVPDIMPLVASVLGTTFKYLTFAIHLMETFERILQFSLRHLIAEFVENVIPVLMSQPVTDPRVLFFNFFEKLFLFQPRYHDLHLVLKNALPVWNRYPLLLDSFFEAWRACDLSEPLDYSFCIRIGPDGQLEDARVVRLLLRLLARIVTDDPKAVSPNAINVLLYYCTLSPAEIEPLSNLISQVLRSCHISQCDPMWLNLKVHHPSIKTGFVTELAPTSEALPSVLLFSKAVKVLLEFSQSPPTPNPEVGRLIQSALDTLHSVKRINYIHRSAAPTASNIVNPGIAWANLYQRFINERSPYFAASAQSPRRYKRSSFIDYRFRSILLVPKSVGEKPKISCEQAHLTSLWRADCVKLTVANRREGVFFVTTDGYRFRRPSGREVVLAADDVTHIFWRWDCHIPNSVEIFLATHRAYLFMFPGEASHAFVQRLTKASLSKNVFVQTHAPAIEFHLQKFTEKWIARSITTFDYLLALNLFSGRTFNSLECYPVFPWVTSDYRSPDFGPELLAFRDFSKPAGALNEMALSQTKEKVKELPPESQWLYSTGYSNPMVICHYLVRLEPFTTAHIALQDGRFDASDRLFQSIPRSFSSLVTASGSPRELSPEFFFLPEFLTNLDGLDLGSRTDEADLNTVELPAWANSPADFVRKHLALLESDECSQTISSWIDLIWGFKQTGPDAIAADNTFDPAMYFSGEVADQTRIGILQLVGQIPFQLFGSPHPPRDEYSPPTLELFGEIPAPPSGVLQFCVDGTTADTLRIFAIDQAGKCFCVRRAQQQIVLECETVTSRRRFIAVDQAEFACLAVDRSSILSLCPQKKLLVKNEHQVHIGAINCIATTGKYIVTGGSDALVALWIRRKNRIEVVAESAVHNEALACVTVSRDYGVVVSCSLDGIISVFSLPNLFFIRSIDIELRGEGMPTKIEIGKSMGDIFVFCTTDERQTIVKGFTLNGSVIGAFRFNWLFKDVLSSMDHRGLDFFIVLKDTGGLEFLNLFMKPMNSLTESMRFEGDVRGIAQHREGLYLAVLTAKPSFMFMQLNRV